MDRGKIFVDYRSALSLERNLGEIINHVNEEMESINYREKLIGRNTKWDMQENHRHHGEFMVPLLKLNDYRLLETTLNWWRDTYRIKGYKEEYFTRSLEVWKGGIGSCLEEKSAREIIRVYEYMEEVLKKEKKDKPGRGYPFSREWEERKDRFTEILLHGSTFEALQLTRTLVTDAGSLDDFYSKVLTYAMYEVGELWQRGEISVAKEHQAASMALRIIDIIHLDFIHVDKGRGKVVVSAIEGEHHELGARIIADRLEADGWRVIYLGRDVPVRDLMDTIISEKPHFISLSITLARGINTLEKIVESIKERPDLEGMRILVGGYLFTYNFISEGELGVDKVSESMEETLSEARLWWKEGAGKEKLSEGESFKS